MDCPDDEHPAVDAAAILSSIWARNALRRGAGLPLWPVRETLARELAQARWRAHVAAHHEATRARVLAAFRARHGAGFGGSGGGRYAVEVVTLRALRATFRAP